MEHSSTLFILGIITSCTATLHNRWMDNLSSHEVNCPVAIIYLPHVGMNNVVLRPYAADVTLCMG